MISRSVGTHDGTFHADEVTACALLLIFDLVDFDKIIRTRDQNILSTCEYVCDVGGIYTPKEKRFDHHQVDYQGPLSSAGMVLLYLKDSGKISDKEYQFLNNNIILGVDAHDNGRDPLIKGLCTYSHIIAGYVPVSHEVEARWLEEGFYDALNFAKGVLERFIQRFRYIQSCREAVVQAMQQSQECLMFDENLPWMDIFFELGGAQHSASFVIMPSDKHWKLRGIPPSMEQRMQVRMPLPEEWAGLLEGDLKKVSGIPGAIFCHKGRFISVWETRNDALKALKYVLDKAKKDVKNNF